MGQRRSPTDWFFGRILILKGFRDGQTNLVQLISQAPECILDYRNDRQFAGDPGPIQIFTPTTNLFVQGVGFFCAETNEVLIISNQVETRVAESLLRSGVFSGQKPGAMAGAGTFLLINSDHGRFDYRSNLVDYAGNVRVTDPQLEMRSPFLSIQFSNTQTVQSILAWDGVTINLTNKGTATPGTTASYFVTNGTELLTLAGDAQWHNGPQEASAAKFTYDPDRHFLTADDQARASASAESHPPACPPPPLSASFGPDAHLLCRCPPTARPSTP